MKSPEIPVTKKMLLQVLLRNRNMKSAQEQKNFLSSTHPTKLSYKAVGIDEKEVKKACILIEKAKKNAQRVIVFGDYDADGIIATTILWETLHAYGLHVRPFIPSREKHGYGLSIKAIEDILLDSKQRPSLLITVDNGIVAHEALERLKKKNIQTILTDHHQIDNGNLPSADAIVHTTQLCGATVAWMLARAVDKKKAESLLDLCGLATIADQVPLFFANRSFAFHGIQALRQTTRLGLLELCRVAGIEKGQIDTYAMNFVLVPRINAIGRIGNALEALRLLCGKNPKIVRQLAGKLHETNTQRQQLLFTLTKKAMQQQNSWKKKHIIVVESSTFHEGVIGLIAGKLSEEFYKPAIVISTGKTTAKGSARSVYGVNITELLREVREELIDVGGHPMAAGFSLFLKNVQAFQKKIERIALKGISKDYLIKHVSVECELPWNLVSLATIELIEQLSPFGSMNPRPVFLLKNAQIISAKEIGKEKNHLKIKMQAEGGGEIIEGIVFSYAKRGFHAEIMNSTVDLVGELQENLWNGKKSVQIKVREIVTD